jgi:hypothetical protein
VPPKLATRKMEPFPRSLRRVTKKPDVAHMKSIFSAVNKPVANWTIGCKPNANLMARHDARQTKRDS